MKFRKIFENFLAVIMITSFMLAIFPTAAKAVGPEGDGGYPWDKVNAIDLKDVVVRNTWGYDLTTCRTLGLNCTLGVSAVLEGQRYYYRDPNGFDVKNCTSFVAWKLGLKRGDFPTPVRVSGNAENWGKYPPKDYQVTNTPSVNDIAWWESRDHVAFVKSIDGNTVKVEQYNRHQDGNYSTESFKVGEKVNGEVAKYLHKKGSTPPPNSNPSSNVDVVLIIDISGSMSSSDPRNLRVEAAKVFIDTMSNNDQISIVAFDDSAKVLQHITKVGNAANRNAIKNTLSQIGAFFGTNLSAGLQTGFQELSASTVTTNKKAAIFLTDGVGSYNNEADQFKSKGWPIYTVGLGANAATDILKDIAAKSGGQYFALLSPSDLQKTYFEISKQVSGQTPVFNQTTRISDLQRLQPAITIPQTQLQATFFINWQGSDVDVKLKSPSGREITPQTAGSDVFYSKGLTYVLYRIENPEPGSWIADIFGTDIPAGGEDLNIQVLSQPNPVPPGFQAEYFNNRNFKGEPVLTRNDEKIDFDWSYLSPAPQVNADFFSVRWTKTQLFDEGVYKFKLDADDSAQLFIDGHSVIETWDSPLAAHTKNVSLTQGEHEIKVEYYERTRGAFAHLSLLQL